MIIDCLSDLHGNSPALEGGDVNLDSEHIISKEDKLEHLGNGEWVDEPDHVTFEHAGFKCLIERIFVKEPCTENIVFFGGHLCGYIFIHEGHPWYGKDAFQDKIDCEVHGGLTFSQESEHVWEIGFDCAHGGDMVPSREKFKNGHMKDKFDKYKKAYPDSKFLNPTYKNINYVIAQCKSLAEQARKAATK